MMQSAILLLLYGLSCWGAGLNSQAWSRAFIRHWRAPRGCSWWHDDAMLLRAGLVLLSVGVAGLAGTRMIGAVSTGVPISVPSPVGIVFIGLMAAAEPFFLRVDENHAQIEGRSSLAWRIYWGGALSSVAVFLIAICTSALP